MFGGLAGTNQPNPSLACCSGKHGNWFNDRLDSALLRSAADHAAESRGQVKTVATPRVTALNNRPAQIESGSQIPVQTTQAAGGTAVVTTTFVSVPLRLSITPQITDAGTVVLRVTIENNTVNTGIAVGGVPGIDTQRMQSEVLVPDGGTTVMGGVLADTEGEPEQRTPGMARIPIYRQSVQAQTDDEVRPKFCSSSLRIFIVRTTMAVRLRERRALVHVRPTIPQPVPLGNPQTNTPTPTQLQQQQPTAPQTTMPDNATVVERSYCEPNTGGCTNC